MSTSLCLFAGLGATAKGQRDLGQETVLIELDPTAAKTLRLNFDPRTVIEADVKGIDFTALGAFLPDVEVILGGPPCQPFSQGSKNGTGSYDPRDCIPDMVRAVRDIQPRMFLMEEVKTLLWAKNRAYYDHVVADFRDAGYRVDFRVIDMSKYGIPQQRKRLITVGIREDLWRYPVWPDEHPGDPITMGAALGWNAHTAIARAKMAPVFGDASWVFERPSTTVVGSFRPEVQSPPGYRKAGDGPRQNQPGAVVTTIEEALTLQGMPTDWPLAGSEAKQRLQVGNSCPPSITREIVRLNLR